MGRASRYEVRQVVARRLTEEQFDSPRRARLKDFGGAVAVVALWSGMVFLIASAALYWTDSELGLAAGVLLGIFLPYGMVQLSNAREKRLRHAHRRLRDAYEDVCIAQSGEMDRLRRKLEAMQGFESVGQQQWPRLVSSEPEVSGVRESALAHRRPRGR
jgi:hypothetical protein